MFPYDFINEIRKTEPDSEMEKCRKNSDEQEKKVIIRVDFNNNEQNDNTDDEKQIDDIQQNLFILCHLQTL